MPKVTINGQIYEAEKGKTVIQVADDVGVHIPRYCYHPDIGIEGGTEGKMTADTNPDRPELAGA